MSSTEFCIKWTNYQSNIVNSVGKLKNESEFVDVTLVCEEKSIKAHKVILSACSDYFKQVFKATPSFEQVVLLPNIQYEDMSSLVQYMYTGQVFIHQDMLGRLLKTAQALQIKGLIEHSVDRTEGIQVTRDVSERQAQSTTISSNSPLLLSPFQQLTPPPSVSPSSSASSLPSPGKTSFPPIKIPSPPTPSYNWSRANLALLASHHNTPSLEGEDWARAAHNNDIMESTKETKADSSRHNEEDETDDELVIEEQEPNATKTGTVEKMAPAAGPEPTAELSGSGNFETNSSEVVRESPATHPRQRWRCMQPRLCNYCWKTFSNSFNLKQHIVNVHIQSQGVNCNICDKVVKNKWYLRKHLVTAHGAPLKRSKNTENTSVANHD